MNHYTEMPHWCNVERYAATLAAYEYLDALPDVDHTRGCLELLKRLHYTQSTATDLRFGDNMQAFILEGLETWGQRTPVIEAMFRSIDLSLTIFNAQGVLYSYLDKHKLISGAYRPAWGKDSKKVAPAAGILYSQYCYLEPLAEWLSEKLNSAKK